MSITAIRKTKLPHKGGPGAAGVRFDPTTKSLKIHDGVAESIVDVKSDGVVEKTAAFTVSVADHGKIFKLNAAAGITVTLPAVSAANRGLKVTFVNASLPTSNDYRISPDADDSIKYGTDDKDLINTAGTDVLGDLVTLVSDGVDGWVVTEQVGIWAKES